MDLPPDTGPGDATVTQRDVQAELARLREAVQDERFKGLAPLLENVPPELEEDEPSAEDEPSREDEPS